MLKKMAMAMVGIAALGAVMMSVANCGDNARDKAEGENKRVEIKAATKVDDALTGEIKIDGSSTVGPITQAVAEQFGKVAPKVKVSVNISGTGGGFKKFCPGDTDINDASRPIKKEEIELCQKNGIEYMGLPVAIDGLSVVVNKDNTWCDDITVEELKKMWDEGSTATKWSDIRSGWPETPLKLFGPGHDSGTFDYFTDKVNGKEKKIRKDGWSPSEDDNILVRGVEGDKGGLAYFGYAYYLGHKDKLKLLKVNGVAPTDTTILDGTYKPLARQIYIYVSKKALERKEVQAFVKFYLEVTNQVVQTVPTAKYTPLPDMTLKAATDRFSKREFVDAPIPLK